MKNSKERDGDDAKLKVADALRTLVIAYSREQISSHDISNQLVNWAKNGIVGFTKGVPVNNLIGWDFIAGFAHELKFVAAEFNNRYELEKDWVDINGLLNFLRTNGIKFTNVKTIERQNTEFEKLNVFHLGELYRYVNGKEKEYHKKKYLDQVIQFLKNKNVKNQSKK